MAPVAVADLSLLGLFARIEEIDRIKDLRKPDDDELATVETEGDAKKAVGDFLASADSGLTAAEKEKATAFLKSQLKALDPHAKGAAPRRAKLEELLTSVGAAPSAPEPAHVVKARQNCKRAKQQYDEIHAVYEKWERGKGVSFKSVDELNAMQKNHAECQKALEAAGKNLELALMVAPATSAAKSVSSAPAVRARPVAAGGAAKNPAARGKAKAQPAAVGGFGGGVVGSSSRWSYQPFNGLAMSVRIKPSTQSEKASKELRPGEVFAVSEERWDDNGVCYLKLADGSGWVWDRTAHGVLCVPAEDAPPRPAPKPKPQKAVVEPPVVLSFECTVSAASQILNISKDRVKELGESCADIRNAATMQFGAAKWKQIEEMSLKIEKEKKEKAREKEKKQREQKIQQQTAKMPGLAMDAPMQQSGGYPKAAAKPKPKPKSAPTGLRPQKQLSSMATGNRFGGFDDSDDDDGAADGWTKVGR